MKKLVYLLALFVGSVNAQNVTIPDPNFKAFLLSQVLNTNNDGEIQVSEALEVTDIYISGSGITDLTGIEAFTNLESFDCRDTSVTSVNLTMLTGLGSVRCYSNPQLTSVDVRNLPLLGALFCYTNSNLTSLLFTGCPLLQTVDCHYSSLTSLDVSGLSNLMNLNCDHNSISSINFTNCPMLDNIEIGSNAITSIDLTGLTNITFLHCNDNLISEIIATNTVNIAEIIADNNQLVDLDCSKIRVFDLSVPGNPLVSLNLKNGFNENVSLAGLLFNSPALQFICEDENQLAALNTLMTTYYPTIHAVVNSYCSFTPGGNYNTITGTVTFDANGNGCDSGDVKQPNIRVNITDASSNTGASFTNTNGNYAFYTQTGNFSLTPNIENPTWFTFSPATTSVPFANNNNNNVVTRDFCLSANGIHPDVEVVVAPLNAAQPGFDATYKVVYRNKGNQTRSGIVEFGYNDEVSDFVSSNIAPSSQSFGTLQYNYANLLPFESRSIIVTLNINSQSEDLAINIGDELYYYADVTPTDENPSDNVFEFAQDVVASFDPNNITCIEGDIVSPSQIGNYLHYAINFENTGNADATNVVVRDVIDANKYDISSLQVLNTSAPVTARLTGNVAEFIFQNINLHSGGHGNILLKMKSKSTLVAGDTVSKRANIYFDYNFPIETLPANTLFQTLSNPDVPTDGSISVYPNPTYGIVSINCKNTIKSIELYDVQGRILQTDIVDGNETTIDISNQSNGVYFIRIISDKGIKVEKIVRN